MLSSPRPEISPHLRARVPLLLVAAVTLVLTTGCAGDRASTLSTGTAFRSRLFEFQYTVVIREIPASAKEAFLWIPSPPETEDQQIRRLKVVTPLQHQVVTEERYDNRAIRFELPAGTDEVQVHMTLEVLRHERIRRPVGPSRRRPGVGQIERWTGPDLRVPIDGKIREWAIETVAGNSTDLSRARAIYDYAVSNLEYDKTGTGWGNGDIYWACDARRGNCTDFHALFIGFNRALGIPAKFEMGFPIPADRGEGEIGGYHCWAQFFLDDYGWIPVDASEANKHPDRREYFFGAHDENRLLFTVGRDLSFPGMKGAPLNFFVYPYVEVDGAIHAEVERRFAYRDLDPAGS